MMTVYFTLHIWKRYQFQKVMFCFYEHILVQVVNLVLSLLKNIIINLVFKEAWEKYNKSSWQFTSCHKEVTIGNQYA